MNIILDLDGTLIGPDQSPRNHLSIFLHYVFDKFDNVSIWTHANNEWFNAAYHNVLKQHMPINKEFKFIWCRDKCESICSSYSSYTCPSSIEIIKPLRDVYAAFPDHHKYNTFILDDNEKTYQYNIANSIPIPSFTGEIDNDIELLKVIKYLNDHLFNNILTT